MTNQIEGVINEGQTVVVVEDLVSTGKSSLNAVFALREVNVVVKGMAAIFTYGLPIAEENFKKADCKLVALSDYNALIKGAVAHNYISETDKKSLLEWRKDPQAWSDRHK
jgi:orotate phosphoribosyltransferase